MKKLLAVVGAALSLAGLYVFFRFELLWWHIVVGWGAKIVIVGFIGAIVWRWRKRRQSNA
ncbi:MAG: hypothetical protein Q8Q94_01195 [bacterium]|nr:hypothetical protein [bacterium]MDZ4299631.1 hypothetical protein [Candidatus Sungbacteria bacterium]